MSVSPALRQVYLGDGLYGEFDGTGIKLHTARSTGEHWVYLEQPVLEQFLLWVEALCDEHPDWGKMQP